MPKAKHFYVRHQSAQLKWLNAEGPDKIPQMWRHKKKNLECFSKLCQLFSNRMFWVYLRIFVQYVSEPLHRKALVYNVRFAVWTLTVPSEQRNKSKYKLPPWIGPSVPDYRCESGLNVHGTENAWVWPMKTLLGVSYVPWCPLHTHWRRKWRQFQPGRIMAME